MPPLPQNFQPLLPSSPIKNLDSRRDKTYIIHSFLKNATLEVWQWMFKTYNKQNIIHVVKTSRQLKEKDVNFWDNYFNIPKKEIK